MKEEDRDLFTGDWVLDTQGNPSTDCFISAPHQWPNQGCGIVGGNYGAPFNAGGGGVYALEWTDDYIQAFYFPRNSIPVDIQNGKPDPSTWGRPYAFFALGANCPDVHFDDMSIVINLTFCGDWAGDLFGTQCPNLGTCNSFVQNNPQKFKEAYWLINYMAVYQN